MKQKKTETFKSTANKMDLITEHDIYLLKQGNHQKLYTKLGAHITTCNEEPGTTFGLWAPNAANVFVTGSFNSWNKNSHPLKQRDDESGVWEGFIPGIKQGDIYKYHLESKYNNFKADKGDPFAFYWEQPPKTASIVWDLSYQWNDNEWVSERHKYNALNAPFSVYEVHLGSWKRSANGNGEFLTYKEIAHELADYVKEMGFTHVELMPITEHPFYGSWGYQTTGYFAPTSRYGTPQDFMYLIDYLHQSNIGVILDWVPSHFPSDEHGLAYFDGTCLYEHADPKMGFHPEWKSYIFNYSRNEVRSFLISSALFWFDKYHIDAIRVDAVASMLYLDYAREDGEWIPNKYGGHENLGAINFLRRLNEAVYASHPNVQMIAEESTAWPMVSRPTSVGGLGFGMKWNMGWMHDTLNYFSKDPVYRKSHHSELAFSIWYAFTENFLLPLSHDEVVHGKGSLIGKMPGDEWQRHANLRLLFGHMYGHPGKKLIFMGGEFAQWKEWNHDEGLEWFVLQYNLHQGMRDWVKDLNHLYKTSQAMYEQDFSKDGFEWIDFHDYEQSIISYIRKGKDPGEIVLAVCNATPVPRHNYKVGVPRKGFWKEVLNSDSEIYGGSGCGNAGGVQTIATPTHGRKHSLNLTLPPLGILFFKN